MSQITERTIKAVRKRHYCAGCLRAILQGEPAVTWVGISDGDFNAVYYHPECREAEVALNELQGTFSNDEWTALHESDSEDYPWLMSEHTKAYLRLIAPSSQVAQAAS